MLNFTSAEVQGEALHLLQTLSLAAQSAGPSVTLCCGSSPFLAGEDCNVALSSLRWKHCIACPALENQSDMSLPHLFWDPYAIFT